MPTIETFEELKDAVAALSEQDQWGFVRNNIEEDKLRQLISTAEQFAQFLRVLNRIDHYFLLNRLTIDHLQRIITTVDQVLAVVEVVSAELRGIVLRDIANIRSPSSMFQTVEHLIRLLNVYKRDDILSELLIKNIVKRIVHNAEQLVSLLNGLTDTSCRYALLAELEREYLSSILDTAEKVANVLATVEATLWNGFVIKIISDINRLIEVLRILPIEKQIYLINACHMWLVTDETKFIALLQILDVSHYANYYVLFERFIRNSDGLRRVLNKLSPDQQIALINAFEISNLNSIIANTDKLKEIFTSLSKEGRTALINKLGKDNLLRFIPDADKLTDMFIILESENGRVLINELGESLQRIIPDGHQLARVFRRLDGDDQAVLINVLEKVCLSVLVKNIEQLLTVLNAVDYYNKDTLIKALGKDSICGHVQSKHISVLIEEPIITRATYPKHRIELLQYISPEQIAEYLLPLGKRGLTEFLQLLPEDFQDIRRITDDRRMQTLVEELRPRPDAGAAVSASGVTVVADKAETLHYLWVREILLLLDKARIEVSSGCWACLHRKGPSLRTVNERIEQTQQLAASIRNPRGALPDAVAVRPTAVAGMA